MKQTLVIAVYCLLFSLQSVGSTFQTQWKKATSCYMQKQYDSAVFYFEQIAAQTPRNADVYYNLGNAYYRLNKIAPAVLNYEKALHIKPSYKEAKDNLAITQARINHGIPKSEAIFFIEWWRSLTAPANASSWATLAAASFVLSIISIWLIRYRKFSLPVQVPGILIFVSLCALVPAFKSASRYVNPRKAVVFENDAPLMRKELKGKPVMLIPEGTTVTIEAENDSWAEVILPDGRSGWVLLEQMKKI